MMQIARDCSGDSVGPGLLGGELFGYLKAAERLADLAAHGVGCREIDAVTRLAFGG